MTADDFFSAVLSGYADELESLRSFVATYADYSREQRRTLEKEFRFELLPFTLASTKQLMKVRPPETEEDKARLPNLVKRIADLEKQIKPWCEIALNDHGEYTLRYHNDAYREAGVAAMKALSERSTHARIVARNSLVTLISNIDTLLSKLARYAYEAHPEKFTDDESTFTFEQLTAFSSIEDARADLINRKIDKTLRKSMSDAIDLIKRLYGLGAGYIDNDSRSRMVEIDQRRNIIVHNDAIVNSTYASKVAPALRQNLEIGNSVGVSSRYLQSSIDTMDEKWTLLISEAWEKSGGTKEHIADELVSLAYEHLKHQRWAVAGSLSRFVMGDQNIPASLRLIAKINFWQSNKWSGNYAEVRKEVENEDDSTLGMRYRLALSALRAPIDETLSLLEQCLAAGEIQPWEAREWPLLREVREHPDFAALAERFDLKPPERINWLTVLKSGVPSGPIGTPQIEQPAIVAEKTDKSVLPLPAVRGKKGKPTPRKAAQPKARRRQTDV